MHSLTYLSTTLFLYFLCNREGFIVETMIKDVVEAKYKDGKTIVHGLLHM